jgi:hypothetical protein
VFPDVRLALVGETVTLMVDPVGLTTTIALAFFAVFALLVAVTVTLLLVVTVGAVKKPLVEIVPADDVQVTVVLVEPRTFALNC